MWNPETRESFSDDGRLQHQLTVQSQQIEEVLRWHDIPVEVAGGLIDDGSVRFQLQTQLASGWERLLVLKDDLMRALGGQDVALSQRDDGQWQVAVSHEEQQTESLLSLLRHLPDVPKATAVLGIGEDGQPLTLNFRQPEITHVLVSGLGSAGKTALLRTLAVSLALHNRQSQVQLIVADLNTVYDGSQRTSLAPLSYLPHMLSEVVYDLDDVSYVFNFLLEECEHRIQHHIKWPTIVMLVDDVLPILQSGNREMVSSLTKLVQEGASAGIHLVLSTQKPETAVFTTLLKANLPVRLVGQMQDEYQARAASGLMGTQAQYLKGAGDFLAVTPKGVVHFQSAYVSDYDLHLAIEKLYQSRPPALLAQSFAQQPKEPRQFLFNGQIVSLEGAVDEVGARIIQEAPKVQHEPLDKEDLAKHQDIIPDVVAKMLARHQGTFSILPTVEEETPVVVNPKEETLYSQALTDFREEVAFSIGEVAFSVEEMTSPLEEAAFPLEEAFSLSDETVSPSEEFVFSSEAFAPPLEEGAFSFAEPEPFELSPLEFVNVAEEERPFADWRIQAVFSPLSTFEEILPNTKDAVWFDDSQTNDDSSFLNDILDEDPVLDLLFDEEPIEEPLFPFIDNSEPLIGSLSSVEEKSVFDDVPPKKEPKIQPTVSKKQNPTVKPIELDLEAVSAKLAKTLSFSEPPPSIKEVKPTPKKTEPKAEIVKKKPVVKRPLVARKAPTPTPMNFDDLLQSDLLKKATDIAPPKEPVNQLFDDDVLPPDEDISYEDVTDDVTYVADEEAHIDYDDEFIPFE